MTMPLPSPEDAQRMPGAFTAFRYVDPALAVYGEYEWVTGDFDCGGCGESEEVEEVIMVPVRVRTFLCCELIEEEEE